jgi:hypothetical protein
MKKLKAENNVTTIFILRYMFQYLHIYVHHKVIGKDVPVLN